MDNYLNLTAARAKAAWLIYAEATGEGWNNDSTALEVFNLACNAYDNACSTTGAKHEGTDYFAEVLLDSIEGLLASRETSEDVRAWYKARGVTA